MLCCFILFEEGFSIDYKVGRAYIHDDKLETIDNPSIFGNRFFRFRKVKDVHKFQISHLLYSSVGIDNDPRCRSLVFSSVGHLKRK